MLQAGVELWQWLAGQWTTTVNWVQVDKIHTSHSIIKVIVLLSLHLRIAIYIMYIIDYTCIKDVLWIKSYSK